MDHKSKQNGHLEFQKRNNNHHYDSIDHSTDKSATYSLDRGNKTQAIGLWSALRIPGVIEYSLCLFFAKIVSYTFLFWLPLYITNTIIGGKLYGDAQAARWAILFDVGGALGGISAGFLVDRIKLPGIINFVMFILAAPCLFLLKFHGDSSLPVFITYMMLSGFLVNGAYALITTAVSASLGSHECLQGNTKAMATVTSIINATGSLGAAVGPLLAGVISKHSWNNVFVMLIVSDLMAAILLSRQVITEIQIIRHQGNRERLSSYVDDEANPLLTSEN